MDAPSTGHCLMLFRSTQALVEVFGVGIVFKQASEIMSLMRDSSRTRLYVLSTPEELPLKEAADLSDELKKLGLPAPRYLLNRTRPRAQPQPDAPTPEKLESWDAAWAREARLELERSEEENEVVGSFLKSRNLSDFHAAFPEVFALPEDLESLVKICTKDLLS